MRNGIMTYYRSTLLLLYSNVPAYKKNYIHARWRLTSHCNSSPTISNVNNYRRTCGQPMFPNSLVTASIWFYSLRFLVIKIIEWRRLPWRFENFVIFKERYPPPCLEHLCGFAPNSSRKCKFQNEVRCRTL